MKTIGILGGMSATSTQLYYRELCRETQRRLGGHHSPDLLIRSLDFAEIEAMQFAGQWHEAGVRLNEEARALERGGAQILILATNTMHKLVDQMMDGIDLPLIHIADATAQKIHAAGLSTPALMATGFTMEEDFYLDRIRSHDLSPFVPDEADRQETHRIIFDELCKNIVTPQSQAAYVGIAERLVERGADSLILGCTEVGMLLNQDNVSVPVFDTTLIHCAAVLDLALAE